MDWIGILWRGQEARPEPSSELTDDERAEILARLDLQEAPNNERLDKVERSLYPLMAEAGLTYLSKYAGRSHGEEARDG